MMDDIFALVPIAILLLVGVVLKVYDKVQDRRFEKRIANELSHELQQPDNVWPPPPKRMR